jgi:hypothetical protein
MTFTTIHNSFSRGELDPTLLARSDFEIFTKGARKLRNMIALWTGAGTLAPGQTYTDIMVDRTNANAPVTNAAYINGVDFQYSVDDDIVYTIIIRPDTTFTVAIDIYYDEVLRASVDGSAYTVAKIEDIHFAPGQDRILFLHGTVPTRQLIRGADHATWTFTALPFPLYPVFDFTVIGGTQYRVAAFTFTPAATTGSGVNLTASSAIFTNNHVGGLFVGGGGIARITSVTSTTVAVMTIIDDFVSTAAIDGKLASLSEIMWTSGGGVPAGADHGWPSRGAFFLNRLALGRSPALPNVVAISESGVYDSFDDSSSDATAGFSASFNGKGNQSVQAIVAEDNLVFLTSNKTFAQNPLVESPLSPSNFYFAPQSKDPASDVEPVSLDNQILHINGNRSQVIQSMYSTADAKYIATPIGLLSAHLFETLETNASWEPKNIMARLYMATQANGTMLFYNTLIDQNVAAWSMRTTRGLYKRVIGDGIQAHVIVERQINLGASYESTMDYAYLSNTDMTAFDDQTTAFGDAGTDVAMFTSQYDYVVFGNDVPFTGLQFAFNTVSSHNLAPTFEYLDGNGNWNVFTPTDGTTGFTVAGNITWTFTDVLDWAPNTVNGVESRFWIRIRRTTETVTTIPIEDRLIMNTGIRLFLEKLNFDKYMDSTVTTSSNSVGAVTGLTNLKGQQVYAIAYGATYGPFFVDSTGATNIGKEFAVVDIGIQYKPKLVPMPLNTPTKEGDQTYSEKYVRSMYVDYVDSLYLQAGYEGSLKDIAIIPLGNYTLGQPVQPVTDFEKVEPLNDWNPRQEFLVTQSLPGPMTIIGVGYELEVS